MLSKASWFPHVRLANPSHQFTTSLLIYFLGTIFGLVLSADNALLAHESERRLSENKIRREARIDLARRGLVGTETEIRKWRAERDETDVD